MLKMSNEPSKMNPYTDKQFEEDLKKWFSETKQFIMINYINLLSV